MVKGQADAMILRLLAQILIKTHAGKVWGAQEAEILKLTREAEELARARERDIE